MRLCVRIGCGPAEVGAEIMAMYTLADPASKLFSLKAYLRSGSVQYHSPYASLFWALLR